MLASRRAEAEALGVPPDLIEDVLRRVMRESYSSENDKGFKTLCPSLRPVVIVVIFFTGSASSLLANTRQEKEVRYAMIHDESRCNGCNICARACRKTNHVPAQGSRLSIAHIPVTDNDNEPDRGSAVNTSPEYRFLRTDRYPVQSNAGRIHK